MQTSFHRTNWNLGMQTCFQRKSQSERNTVEINANVIKFRFNNAIHISVGI